MSQNGQTQFKVCLTILGYYALNGKRYRNKIILKYSKSNSLMVMLRAYNLRFYLLI